jgi:aryl-alcohol dehydrogenase-like predicted oxidoreductase
MTARIGLGLAALGRPGYINLDHDQDLPPGREVEDLRHRTHELLDQAWQAGVRYFDAARSYGLAEMFLGEWLTPERRSQLTIGSKWGYTYVADWRDDATTHEVKDHSLQTFERQWPETLAALGGPPDFYLVHSLTSDSPALSDAKLLERLGELAADGVRVGLSTSGPHQAETLREALKLGGPFSAVQSTWNVLEPSVGTALAEAHDAGWFVVVKEAVANGRLTAKADETPFNTFAAKHGVAPDALAIGAAAAQPWADVVLSGAITAEQLESNLAHATAGPLTEFAQKPYEYWSERSALPWV